MKQKKIEAWAVDDDRETRLFSLQAEASDEMLMHEQDVREGRVNRHWRLVHLVESSPADARELRALRRVMAGALAALAQAEQNGCDDCEWSAARLRPALVALARLKKGRGK